MKTPRRPFRVARAILVVAILLLAWSVSGLAARGIDGLVVSSFSPVSGPIGTVLTIHGSAFTRATRVTLGNGVPAAYTVDTDDKITAVVPSGAVIGRIKVATPSGTAASPVAFQVILPPSITSIFPSSGVAGTVVTLFGANLEGSAQVRFGVTNAPFTKVSASTLTTTVPQGATTSDVSVTTPGGLATSSAPLTVVHLRKVLLHRPVPLVIAGRVTPIDGFDACAQGVAVQVQREVSGRWRLVASDITRTDGSYRILLPESTGLFRTRATRSVLATGDVCRLAISGEVPHPGPAPPPAPPSPPPSSGTVWGIFSSPRDGLSRQEAIQKLESEIGVGFSGQRIYTGMDVDLPTPLDRELASREQVIYQNFSSWTHVNGKKVCIPWSEIASGAADGWIVTQARNIRAWGYPMLMTFTHEPTVNNDVHPQCGTPEEYRAAFDHVVQVFDAQGATNVTWVWTLTSSTFNGDNGGPAAWEPSDYDVVGVDGYNHADRWRPPDQIFRPAEEFAVSRGKPLLIGEIGCEELPGDPTAKADWITQAIALFRSWGHVRAIMWTNAGGNSTFWLDSSPEALAALAAAGRQLLT